MRYLCILALLAVASYGDATIQESFVKGAESVPELHLKDFPAEPALQLKKAITEAFGEFSRQIDLSLSRNATLATMIVDQRLKNYNNLFEHLLPAVNSGYASHTTFNQFLELMDEMYKVFLDLYQGIHRSEFRKIGQRSSIPALDDVFLYMDKQVRYDMESLQQWTANLLLQGVTQVDKDGQAILNEYRTEYLYPWTRVIQSYAEDLKNYEDIFQSYSSTDVWQKYKEDRDKLVQIEV
ncbi:uncharacterized protein [Anabrus simplex]|uniref:uncharacterized protein isoform X2 n=1 Tax=Anabrus simplex TaxID=316456 RepID=UPI0035A3B56A